MRYACLPKHAVVNFQMSAKKVSKRQTRCFEVEQLKLKVITRLGRSFGLVVMGVD